MMVYRNITKYDIKNTEMKNKRAYCLGEDYGGHYVFRPIVVLPTVDTPTSALFRQ